ncbi:hypothetical protein LCGC14_1665160 [marine sediment metagenome]|uniref:C2H2-type domain-containing protein n=1 Tax=marine sediment metagenome TaxID=412755 RepID=A0A0F9HST7_9ZZZZ
MRIQYACPVGACGKEYSEHDRRGSHVKVIHGLIENEFTGNWIQNTGSNRRRIRRTTMQREYYGR